MNRSVGWFGRQMQWYALGVGLVLAVVLNIDTVFIVRTLWNDDEALRQSIVEFIVQEDTLANLDPDQPIDPDILKDNFLQRPLPIGWGAEIPDTIQLFKGEDENGNKTEERGVWPVLKAWIPKWIGWFLTGLAVSKGAPFWFDVLNKFVKIRTSKREDSESQAQPEAAGNAEQ